METRDGFSLRASIRAGWLLAALGCVSLSANAQSDFGQKIWWKADHNSMAAEVNRSIGIPSATYPAAGTPNVNGARISNASGAWPTASSKTLLPFPSKSVPIDVVAKMKPASAAAALGRLAQKVGPFANAVALVTFAAEIGFILTDGPSGPDVKKADPLTCTTLPCTGFGFAGYPIPYSYTRTDACSKLYNWFKANHTTHTYGTGTGGLTHEVTGSQNGCVVYRKQGTTTTDALLNFSTNNTLPAQTQTYSPSSLSALEDKIANEAGWPSNSHIRDALVEAIKSGETIEYDPAQVSGPASKVGNSSTTNSPDGTVTTVAVNHNYTYNGPKVTVTTKTTTTTVNPATGATSTSTKTDTEAAPDAPDTPSEPTEEKNPCELNPNALGCAELDTPSEEIPRDTETISYEEESVFGSGSCPANLTAHIATLGASFTVWDWAKTCEYALPLRFLVLGLASFGALLIVMPGGSNQT